MQLAALVFALATAQLDSLFFDMTQVSLGVDKEVNPGVYFHAQFDFASNVNAGGAAAGANGVGINEAYFFVDELFGDIGGRVGAFALPISQEHNGPFRTCNLTITPSVINSFLEQARPYGLELQKTKDVQPDDLMWKFGIVSGTDFGAAALLAPAPAGFVTDATAVITNMNEGDDGFGFYVSVGKKPQNGGFGWNLTFFDNGGDNATLTHIPSNEVDFFNLGLEWSNDDILVLVQYLSGTIDGGTPATEYDVDSFYFLINYKVDEKQSLTLRYDDYSYEDNVANGYVDEGNVITFAYNRQVTDNSMFQFEYLTFDNDAVAPAVDQDDDLIQLRYKVHF